MPAAEVRQVPLLDLKAQFREIRDDVMSAILRVCESQELILGAEVERLEARIAGYCSARYAIGCASGSDALMLALMALGVGPGDRVLTAPFTFFATAGAIARLGAEPVFVDVNGRDFNLDPSKAAAAITETERLRAVIPVHLYGGCADMSPILEAARSRGIPVIEDAAQSLGAEHRGVRAGSLGSAGCFSFYPTKNLGAFGEGGIITTNDEELADRLRALRVHGSRERYLHEWLGVNSRLDAIQAAVLNVKFTHLDRWTAARQTNAAAYLRLFAERGVSVALPKPAEHQTRHVYNQFVIRCQQRDQLRRYLTTHGISTEVYYPLPLHLQPCFSGLGYKPGDFPISESLANSALALPVGPGLGQEDIEYVVGHIAAFFSSREI